MVKIDKALLVGDVILPAGSELQISNEGLLSYNDIALQPSCIPGLELDANDLVKLLSMKYSEGFNELSLAEVFGKNLVGYEFCIVHANEHSTLLLSKDKSMIGLSLNAYNDNFVLTGEHTEIHNIDKLADIKSMLSMH
jgi:hypothetical protein